MLRDPALDDVQQVLLLRLRPVRAEVRGLALAVVVLVEAAVDELAAPSVERVDPLGGGEVHVAAVRIDDLVNLASGVGELHLHELWALHADRRSGGVGQGKMHVSRPAELCASGAARGMLIVQLRELARSAENRW